MKPTDDKILNQVLQDIEKQFGKGSVMKLGQARATKYVNAKYIK